MIMSKISNPTKHVDYPIYHSTLTEIMEVYNVKEDELGDYKIIQIVRNPFDRFISAWRHQMEIVSRFTNTPHYVISLPEMIDKVKNFKPFVNEHTLDILRNEKIINDILLKLNISNYKILGTGQHGIAVHDITNEKVYKITTAKHEIKMVYLLLNKFFRPFLSSDYI
jgi:hypothetical protein